MARGHSREDEASLAIGRGRESVSIGWDFHPNSRDEAHRGDRHRAIGADDEAGDTDARDRSDLYVGAVVILAGLKWNDGGGLTGGRGRMKYRRIDRKTARDRRWRRRGAAAENIARIPNDKRAARGQFAGHVLVRPTAASTPIESGTDTCRGAVPTM